MRIRVKVYGLVQGVFFRHGAKLEAERLGLMGWVRNNPNGSVEVLVEGSREGLKAFIAWCEKGSPAALVEKTEVEWQRATGEFGQFEIIR